MTRIFLAGALILGLMHPVFAQETLADTPTMGSGLELFEGFTDQTLDMGLGTFEVGPPPPIVYGGCLMKDDGITPIICKGSATMLLPEGMEWRNDPEARVGAPQYCLWWNAGGYFLGVGENRVCREGKIEEQDNIESSEDGSQRSIREEALRPIERRYDTEDEEGGSEGGSDVPANPDSF